MSFLTLGIFWVGQQTQLNLFSRTDRDLSWIHLGFLLLVSLMPFSTALFASWRYAARYGLVEDEVVKTRGPGVRRRILVAQALYAARACLCVFNTYWSLGFIILIQSNFVIAPRIGVLGQV